MISTKQIRDTLHMWKRHLLSHEWDRKRSENNLKAHQYGLFKICYSHPVEYYVAIKKNQ